MVLDVDNAKLKKYKFKVNTLYLDGDYLIKRSAYKNRLYIYIYKYRFPSFHNIIALRVIVSE